MDATEAAVHLSQALAQAKKFRLQANRIQPLVPAMGGCIASDRITVDGKPVGSMLREAPTRPEDSGWVFLAGDEAQAYLDNPAYSGFYDVNTIANYDPGIIPYLYALPGQRFDRDPKTGAFVEAPDSQPDDTAGNQPPGVQVVQGHVTVDGTWSIDLASPFRRRLEGGSHVMWRPGLTLWVSHVRLVEGSKDDRMRQLRQVIDAAATDLRVEEHSGLVTLSYRLRERGGEAKAASLYAFVLGSEGHLQIGAYFDREDEAASARELIESVRRV